MAAWGHRTSIPVIIPSITDLSGCDASLAHGLPSPRSRSGLRSPVNWDAETSVRDALALLRATVGDVSYNVVFHSAPSRVHDDYHWHVHLLPKVTTQAGFELGTGVPINICPPEVAADELRAVGASV